MTTIDDIAARHAEPHPKWKLGDKSGRHPQSVAEWDYRNDPTGGAKERSIKRLNVAMDYDDPREPDQMALVLRIDLSRLMADWQHKNAAFETYGRMLAEVQAARTEITRLTAALADAEARADALMESQYRAGMKAGWNYCVSEDEDGYQRAMEYQGHLKPLQKSRALAQSPEDGKQEKV